MDLSPATVLIVTAVTVIGLLLLGLPIAFAIGSAGALVTLLLWGPSKLTAVVFVTWDGMGSFVLLACLMFYLMANILQQTAIADDLFEMISRWLGFLRGGLAIGTVGVCAIFAAMAGVGSAGTVTMGLIGIPAMLKRKYHKYIAVGCVAAGGPLGILIPPSIVMIFYCAFAGESVGKMFIAGVFPGLLLLALFCSYIGIRCYLQPQMAPLVPVEERATFKEKLVSTRAVLLPICLISLVLGTIYLGVCTPSESAGVGAVGAFIVAVIQRRLTREGMLEALTSSVKLNALAMWCYFGGAMLASVLNSAGVPVLVRSLVVGLEINRWFILIGMQFIFFILGMFLEPLPIIILTIPTFLPLVTSMGFDMTWFGLLFVMNMQLGYLTPPFGFSLIYLKAVSPKEITMGDIIRSCFVFIPLQALGLSIVALFPQIALWLPRTMMYR